MIVNTGEINYLKTLVWIVFSSLLVYILKKCYKQWRKINMAYKFKGPEDESFLFGQFKIFGLPSDELRKKMSALAREYYPHHRVRILYDIAVIILSPEDCEIIMGTKKHSSKSAVYEVLRNWLKDGLLLSSGKKWNQRRKILTPAFHFKILKDFITVFSEETERLVGMISSHCSEVIDVVPLVSDFTLLTINETAMGTKLNKNDKNQRKYLDAVYDIEDVLRYRGNRPWLHFDWIYIFFSIYRTEQSLLKVLHNFTRSVIKKRMDNFKEISEFETQNNDDDMYTIKKKKRLAMLDILIQAMKDGEHISYEGICEEVDTFMFEGHDTTSTAISFCLMLIANHPEIQEQIHEEIKSIFGEEKRTPEYNDLQKMELLERCIKESLRLYPSVHFISRLVDEDTTLTSGLVVPKDINLHIAIFDVHRNPEIYPQPEKFDPDRFLPQNCQNRHPYAYLPFSAGPRNCIGQKFAMLEIKTVIIGILQHFKIEAIDTPETIVLKADIILKTRDGIRMKFIKRN